MPDRETEAAKTELEEIKKHVHDLSGILTGISANIYLCKSCESVTTAHTVAAETDDLIEDAFERLRTIRASFKNIETSFDNK